ncbi:hypothetical protein IJM86_00840 [bacterium]|nr:hypothetical protein [bacterium]
MQNIAKIDIIGLWLRVISCFTVFDPNPRRQKIPVFIIVKIGTINRSFATMRGYQFLRSRSSIEKKKFNVSSKGKGMMGECLRGETESSDQTDHSNHTA